MRKERRPKVARSVFYMLVLSGLLMFIGPAVDLTPFMEMAVPGKYIWSAGAMLFAITAVWSSFVEVE